MAGIYISYPFCSQKCTYCNFASGVLPRELEPRYTRALASELAASEWPSTPDTVYLGGGTPSLMDPATLSALLHAIPGQHIETTLEVAPGGISSERAHAWSHAGINRVSLGVQSFVATELARAGRKHSAEIVQSEVAILRNTGVHNFNLDLIAGLPGQTAASWSESLDWVERLAAPHVSVYMLEVDEDSRLGKEMLGLGQRYGAATVPSDDQIAGFYETAVERLARAGVARYEISNFAQPGRESRHNLKYWRRDPYLGFGADAHSFDGVWRWQNAESAGDYVTLIENGQSPVVERTAADATAERFFLGLRLADGIPEGREEPFGDAISHFVREGLLERVRGRVRLTPRGILLSNEVFAEFIGAPVS
jgi:oxygen-independent coproporphyrinogen-3 oxidase